MAHRNLSNGSVETEHGMVVQHCIYDRQSLQITLVKILSSRPCLRTYHWVPGSSSSPRGQTMVGLVNPLGGIKQIDMEPHGGKLRPLTPLKVLTCSVA